MFLSGFTSLSWFHFDSGLSDATEDKRVLILLDVVFALYYVVLLHTKKNVLTF